MSAGLYLHVPFCRQRCPYCDFNVLTGAGTLLRQRYVAALRSELAALAEAGPRAVAPPGADRGTDTGADTAGRGGWPLFGSVFVGGGTPTQLRPTDLAGILSHARAVLPLADDAEVTVEANPDDVDADVLAPLVEAGLTRLSIGAQSFASHVLAFLGRAHRPERTLTAVAAARDAGVAQVSVDLIYGTPCESAEDWAQTLDTALAAGPDHLSAYALTVEANTPYAADIRRGGLPAPDDDVQAERMAATHTRLARAGFEHYEISNWARPGAASRHNCTYWRGGDWLAAGAGAHGHWRGRRWWNTRPTGRYIEQVTQRGSAVAGEEVLDEATRRIERLMMGLRLSEGVSRAQVQPLDEAQAARLVHAGLLVDDGQRVCLTDAGRALAGDVTARLLPDDPVAAPA